jgi:hypothetical protein
MCPNRYLIYDENRINECRTHPTILSESLPSMNDFHKLNYRVIISVVQKTLRAFSKYFFHTEKCL